MSEFPYVEESLVEWLEKIYPDCSPELDTPEREIWANRGAVGVVRKLRSVLQEQQSQMLGGP